MALIYKKLIIPSNNSEYFSSLEFEITKEISNTQYLYSIAINSPEFSKQFNNNNNLIFIDNEWNIFGKQIQSCIKEQALSQKLIFQPQEPNFYLMLKPDIDNNTYVTVEFWWDYGNYRQSAISTWDGIGVRFIADIREFQYS